MSNAAPPTVAPADLVELGRIAAAYGVKGWVKIQPHSADADVLLSIAAAAHATSAGASSRSSRSSSPEKPSSAASASTWWLMRPALPGTAAAASGKTSPAIAYVVKAARAHGSTVVAQLAGIDDRDQAEALKGMAVCAPRSAFPAPEEDEYYWVDLIGCALYGDDDGTPVLLGVVDEVLDNGAHAVLKVLRQGTGPAGDPQPLLDARGRRVEMLVPFVQAHIRAVDLQGRRIDSDWPLDF
ncbi:16S rRNA processing protein RimM [Bordetella genomosp. 8]|uniref:Ribosome maturation factor RimM n=1 Tax=Bordetella genomosp. 8 TaxID=1416806 RepID=A0A1W6YIZ4_9BORD|nr:ribosome maturation factor RimM [Bordetella genomosp. 8]ARP80998.1 16S rRNA processing protein RimM [Bordetella genomosp. 8]